MNSFYVLEDGLIATVVGVVGIVAAVAFWSAVGTFRLARWGFRKVSA